LKRIGLLQKISIYGDDILADDAFFMQGEIMSVPQEQGKGEGDIPRILTNTLVAYMLQKPAKDSGCTRRLTKTCCQLTIPIRRGDLLILYALPYFPIIHFDQVVEKY